MFTSTMALTTTSRITEDTSEVGVTINWQELILTKQMIAVLMIKITSLTRLFYLAGLLLIQCLMVSVIVNYFILLLDTFEIVVKKTGQKVPWTYEGVVWDVDKNVKYSNKHGGKDLCTDKLFEVRV